ncbi:hypothetical protein LMG28614_05847 [Paraburkholderia ultramafica]|uniref:Uncharacterized protein n=1 Tax=Paraburkholderia ultramafica TaxID=1544867 RepID=A0A6S7BKF5_9BURK|nr:hypothetical protein [Paraburkholderia ultramafica]CAB3803551.1 hypothetical protein LMG28614_05847 [Paraburkholderia ultramafica]
MKKRGLVARLAVATTWIGLYGALSTMAHAQSSVLPFETHAEFFSAQTHQKVPLDPQVFVAEPSAPGAVGPQAIKHVAGLRNALIADDASLPISTALNKPLHMTLGEWLGAKGDVIFTPRPDGREKITLAVSNLKPDGHYSLFENHFDQKPVGFTPLDGTGKTNNFVADASGKAAITVVAPAPLTHDNAVLLVYHSDGKTHGQSRGNIGVDAHHQLIARP